MQTTLTDVFNSVINTLTDAFKDWSVYYYHNRGRNRVCDKTIEYINQIPYFIKDKLFNWKNVYHVGV